jgi:hypothetical protein
MNNLNCLDNLRLEDLVLQGNPVCDKYQDRNQYIRYDCICLIAIGVIRVACGIGKVDEP